MRPARMRYHPRTGSGAGPGMAAAAAAAAEDVQATHPEEPVRGMWSGWGCRVQQAPVGARYAGAHLAGAGRSEGRPVWRECWSCQGN